jgi:hypothetical protein
MTTFNLWISSQLPGQRFPDSSVDFRGFRTLERAEIVAVAPTGKFTWTQTCILHILVTGAAVFPEKTLLYISSKLHEIRHPDYLFEPVTHVHLYLLEGWISHFFPQESQNQGVASIVRTEYFISRPICPD